MLVQHLATLNDPLHACGVAPDLLIHLYWTMRIEVTYTQIYLVQTLPSLRSVWLEFGIPNAEVERCDIYTAKLPLTDI